MRSMGVVSLSRASVPPVSMMPQKAFNQPTAEGISRSSEPSFGRRSISLHALVAIVAVIDVLTIAATVLSAHLLLAYLGREARPALAGMWITVGLAAAVFAVSATAWRIYDVDHIFFNIWGAGTRFASAAAFTFATIAVFASNGQSGGGTVFLWGGLWIGQTVSVALIVRVLFGAFFHSRIRRGHFVHRAVSVSVANEPWSADELRERTKKYAEVVDAIEFESPDELSGLESLVSRFDVDLVFVKISWADVPVAMVRLGSLRQLSVDVLLVPVDDHLNRAILDARRLGGGLVLTAAQTAIDPWGVVFKRAQDIVVGSMAVVVFTPAMLAIAVLIKLESGGPVLFRQTRVGHNGKTFELLKFRSMRNDMADAHAAIQTSRNDRRVTRVGKFIRKTSLDELPQLFNVLRGSMSIVGPRPHALETRAEGRLVSQLADDYASRHRVKPGMTGWAQVNGCRGELTNVELVQRRVGYDLEYIENWSMWFDIQIMFRTAIVLLYDPGAY